MTAMLIRGESAAPVLWHLKLSHYNEKARWALDHKRVAHVRRAIPPGAHRAIARRLSGKRTFPVLVLDGEAIGDSSRIIAALERSHPEPPLYPADAEARRRALALEDFFDEELGPHIRLLVFGLVLEDGDLTLAMLMPGLPPAGRLGARAGYPLARAQLVAELGIDECSVALAWEKVRAAGQRFRAELGPDGYLAGGSFTVADLTLAALAAPVVCPPQFPYRQPQRGHRLMAPLRDALADAGLIEWTLEIYARHRSVSAEIGRSRSQERSHA